MANIIKLPDSTIQLIAAGEVITRPVNVVKELLENSLDAGASNIRLTIEQGGIKLIQIIDNGIGISQADAGALCRRHTTSKLRTANDLDSISTFGFRGEALASISEMANIEVKSFNMKSDQIGWLGKYSRGELVLFEEKYLQNSGTQIRVTKLFSTSRQRKSSFQTSFVDEKKAITDLVTRYAIHHRYSVTMTLHEGSTPDLVCLLAPMNIGPCIGMFFGIEMENNLFEFRLINEEPCKFEAHLVFSYKKSSTTYNNMNFILFVNHRLVDCTNLKRELDAIVSEFLTSKHHSVLLCIDLNVPSKDIDVNMHPAKTTVALHYQTEIISLLSDALRNRLQEKLSTQTMRPIIINFPQERTIKQLFTQSQSENHSRDTSNLTDTKRIRLLAPNCLTHQRLSVVSSTPVKRPHDLVHNDSTQPSLCQIPQPTPNKSTRRDLNLRSIHELRQLVIKEKSRDPARTIKNSVFVGIFDHDRALIQHETRLYAISLKAYLQEQFYQFYLYDFGNFPPIEVLPPGNKIKFIIETYLNDMSKHEPAYYKNLKYNTPDKVIEELMKHSMMYEDYLSLKLTSDQILTIPCIMPDEVPNLVYLGKFLVDLVNLVDYRAEKECLRTIGRVVADFYSQAPANLKDREVHRRYHDLIEKKLYVAIKNYLLMPDWLFTKQNICQISDTKDLYKVFERC